VRNLRQGIDQLHALVAGGAPALGGRSLVEVSHGTRMVTGTTLPMLGSPLTVTHSGLVVPASSLPQPLDAVRTYLTAEEVFGATPPLEWIREQLACRTLEDVLVFVADALCAFRQTGAKANEVDDRAARTWFTGLVLERVLNLLRPPDRGLVVPQALLVLAKLACRDSGDCLLPGVEFGNLTVALMGVGDHLTHVSDGVEVIAGEGLGSLSRHLTANQYFNASADELHLFARFVRRWLQLPQEHTHRSHYVDLQALYREVAGVEIGDLMALGMALWFAATRSGPPVVSREFFAPMGWSRQRLDGVLDLISVDLPQLRHLVRRETAEHGLTWAISTFERYPVARLDEDRLLVIDPALLLRRIFGAPPLLDVTWPLEASGDKRAKKRAARIKGFFQYLAEAYVREVLDDITAPLHGAAQRVYGEAAIQAAWPGRRNADSALDYGDAWVVVEITTSRLKRESISGMDATALDEDLIKLAAKAEQLHSTIEALRESESTLTGAPGVVRQRYFPLLVVTEGFPINPATLLELRERARLAGLLTGPGVAPLEVVDCVELEMIEALQEDDGPSLRQILDRKAASTLAQVSMRDFLIRCLHIGNTTSARLRALCELAVEPAMAAVRHTEHRETDGPSPPQYEPPRHRQRATRPGRRSGETVGHS
jgi:hypothetical protein